MWKRQVPDAGRGLSGDRWEQRDRGTAMAPEVAA